MALTGKLEKEIEIKAPADKFYSIFRSQTHQIPNICSDKVQKIEVHEGDWETLGSVKNWNYILEGTAMTAKETVEAIDEENKTVTYNALDGDVMKHYKSIKATIKVTAKDEGSLVKWTLEYEKQSEEIPAPDNYLDFATNITKDIEAHLLKA